MSTELSMLDLAERGESHGDLVGGHLRQPDGRHSHPTFEPIAQTRPSVVQEQNEDLGEGLSPA
jgi:hypothetical protein